MRDGPMPRPSPLAIVSAPNCRESVAVPARYILNTSDGWTLAGRADNSLDSTRAIVGWTLLTVFAFWTPVALLAYMVVA
jgi:hypothetical protein